MRRPSPAPLAAPARSSPPRSRAPHGPEDLYDARLDVFRWSGAILVENDPADPFHLCFGEYFPGDRSPLVVSSELFRSLAAGLGPIDLPTAVREPTMPAGRSTGRPTGSGIGPVGHLARPAAAGGSRLPIAGVRGFQGAGPRALDILPALPPFRAAPGPPRDEGGAGPGGVPVPLHRGGPGRPLEPLVPRPPGAGGPSSSPRGG